MKNLHDSNKAMLQTMLRLQKFTRHLHLSTQTDLDNDEQVYKSYFIRTVIVNARGKLMVVYNRAIPQY